MSREIHSVVKNADYVDDVLMSCAVHDDMPSPATMTRDVDRPDAGPQIVTREASKNVRARVEFGNGGKNCRFVGGFLTRAKNVAGIGEDADEILLRLRTEDDTPRFVGHDGSGAATRAFAPTALR